ncbi:MAG: hypothetical protein KDN05_01385 [Verrucomicrobiae bacterium]|nr:hypothetical protein [Verrucomicrobiae bacterium]
MKIFNPGKPAESIRLLAKTLCVVGSVLLTSCFEHDAPFTTRANKNPEAQLLGVWKDRENPYYYAFRKIDDTTMEVACSEFCLEHSDYIPVIRKLKVICYALEGKSLLIAQLVKSNQGKDDLDKWGYFPYVIDPAGRTMEIYYLAVPKNGDRDAAIKAVAEHGDSKPVRNLEKTSLPLVPKQIPEDDLQKYKLEAQKKEIEALKSKVESLERAPRATSASPISETGTGNPIPVVSNHSIAEDAWVVNGEFDYGAKVSFDVTNLGDAGVVDVAVTLTSSEGSWTRREKRYFEKGEKKNLFAVFTEISVNSKEIQYRINCTK